MTSVRFGPDPRCCQKCHANFDQTLPLLPSRNHTEIRATGSLVMNGFAAQSPDQMGGICDCALPAGFTAACLRCLDGPAGASSAEIDTGPRAGSVGADALIAHEYPGNTGVFNDSGGGDPASQTPSARGKRVVVDIYAK